MELLRQLDAIPEDQWGSPEADAIRDQMEEPWYAMTPEEQDRFNGVCPEANKAKEATP